MLLIFILFIKVNIIVLSVTISSNITIVVSDVFYAGIRRLYTYSLQQNFEGIVEYSLTNSGQESGSYLGTFQFQANINL